MNIIKALSGGSRSRGPSLDVSGDSLDMIEMDREIKAVTTPAKGSQSPRSSSINVEDILSDCETFISQVNQRVLGKSPSGLLRFRQWGASPGSQETAQSLNETFGALIGKIEDAELKLRDRVVEMSDTKYGLRDHAFQLQGRICSCILHMTGGIDATDGLCEELRDLVEQLSHECSTAKAMALFNEDVIRQKKLELRSRGLPFVGWRRPGEEKDEAAVEGSPSPFNSNPINKGNMHSKMVTLTDKELEMDRDHSAISQRLQSLRDTREKISSKLGELLEIKEARFHSIAEAKAARERILAVLKSNGEKVPDALVTDFDHQSCKDCMLVCDMTVQCAEQYETIAPQAMETSRRLSNVVEIRERVRDIWDSAQQNRPSV